MASRVSSRHSGDELPYLARLELGEPESAAGTHRDTNRVAASGRNCILGDLAGLRIELTDLVGKVFCEPECAAGTHRDAPGAAARMREGILGDLASLRIDLANPVPVELGEPQIATRARRNTPGAATMWQWE